MKKMGISGVKWLKIAHLFFMVLMLGGIITSVTLRFGLSLSEFDDVYMGYKMLQDVSDFIVRYGAQGLLLTAVVYGLWTNWGFFRYRWVTVKWIIFMFQTIFGIFFIDRWMVDNLSILEAERSMALTNATFLQNHWLMQVGAAAQTVGIVFLIWVSVFKPWKRKAEA